MGRYVLRWEENFREMSNWSVFMDLRKCPPSNKNHPRIKNTANISLSNTDQDKMFLTRYCLKEFSTGSGDCMKL